MAAAKNQDLSPEQAEEMRQQVAAFDAKQAEEERAAKFAAFEPVMSIVDETEPLTITEMRDRIAKLLDSTDDRQLRTHLDAWLLVTQNWIDYVRSQAQPLRPAPTEETGTPEEIAAAREKSPKPEG